MMKPRLTATVMFGLRSMFNSCDLANIPALFKGQPLEDQEAQRRAATWVIAMQAWRDAHKRPREPARLRQRKPD